MESIDFDRAPEGSTHYDPVDSNYLRQLHGCSMVWHLGRGWRHHNGQYPDDLSTRGHIVKLPPKRQKQWNGEGLPPVGTICEVRHEEIFEGRPLKVEILKHHKNGASAAFFWIDAPSDEPNLYWAGRFYPLRTPDQVVADERRTRFEAWFRTEVDSDPSRLYRRDAVGSLSAGQYVNESVESFWIGYNAALDGVEFELPQPTGDIGWDDCLNTCRSVLEAAFLRVWP